MTSSPTHPSLLFFWPSPTHLSLVFSALPCPPFPNPCRPFPKIFRRFPKLFRRCSPPIRSQDNLRKIGSNLAHDVSLMRFIDFLGPSANRYLVGTFQQPIRSRSFPKIFPKIFRRCSPPIRSQEICDVNFGKSGLI